MLSRIVLFGLGNPGAEYDWTPHNLGFRVLDAMAAKKRRSWERRGRSIVYAEYDAGRTSVFLAKPLTYMNLAGQGLHDFREAVIDFKPGELLVIVDDIALPFGRLRLRQAGSHGGHNGLLSIADELQTTRYPRLRMGVGPVPAGEDPADFVLSPFGLEKRDDVDGFVQRAVSCVEDVIYRGFSRAMSLHNADGDESD